MIKKYFIMTMGLLCIVNLSSLAAEGDNYIMLEDFESISPPALPVGWLSLNANHDDRQWESRLFSGSRGGQCLRYLSHATIPADDWFVTSAISLETSSQYTFHLKSRVTDSSRPHHLTVWTGTSPTTESMTTQILDIPVITAEEITETTGTFSVSTEGLYYVGIHCTSIPNSLAVFVDDVIVSEEETNLGVEVQLTKDFYSENNTYAPDEEIECLVIVKNSGSSPLTVNGLLTVGHTNDPESVLSFIIINPDGEEVPFEARYKPSPPQEEDLQSIATGESVYKYYNLNSGTFDFSLSGIYNIKAVYKNRYRSDALPVWLGRIISSSVSLTVE